MIKAVNGPISIVTMVGPAGSGKSSLAGRALLDNPAAFEEAKSKEPCTKVRLFFKGQTMFLGIDDLREPE